MNHKILIIAFSWLATITGLFLLSAPTQSPQNSTALILNAQPSSSPSNLQPLKTVTLKKTFTPTPASVISPSISSFASPIATQGTATTPTPPTSPDTSHNTVTFSPTPTATPTPSPSPQFIQSTPTSSPTPTFSPTPTATPQSSGQHTFYTSSHWKAKYYYCDTDNSWKDLSPTYLKSFPSEQELLANYSRISHEPCKN